MLEARVERLEADVKDIKEDVRALRSDFGDMRASMARVEGRLDMLVSRTPTALQLWGMILSTWTAGAGIVFVMLRFLQP